MKFMLNLKFKAVGVQNLKYIDILLYIMIYDMSTRYTWTYTEKKQYSLFYYKTAKLSIIYTNYRNNYNVSQVY